MESGIVEVAVAGLIALSFFAVFFITMKFTRSLMATAEDTRHLELAAQDTPAPSHAELLEMVESIGRGDARLGADFSREWADELSSSSATYVSFLLSVSGSSAFPDELPAASRKDWAFSRLTGGRRIALLLSRSLGEDGLSTLAREGMAHEDSVEVAHEYLALWEGSAIADVERDEAADERARHRESRPGDVGAFDGSLQLAQTGSGGELTVTHEEGALSQTGD